MSNSTIAAVATPLGESSIGVIRISGDRAIETADKVFFAFSGEKLSSLSGYKAAYGEIKDGARVLDENNKWVEKREQKNSASDRNVPLLIPELCTAIKRDWKPEGKLLAVSQATLRNAVTRVCARAGVKRVTVHQLRHSFASLAAHLRIPMEIAMEIGGWSNDKIMREIYTHIAQSDIERYKNELWKFYNE